VAGDLPQSLPGNGSQRPERQRELLVAAVAKTAAEHGYAGLTVERIMAYAGVGREVFDAHFENREQGLLAAQGVFLDHLLWEAGTACERVAPWPLRLRAGLQAVLSTLTESAPLARVFTVEADAAGLALVERRLAALDDFARLMRNGRQDYPAAAPLPEVTERLLVGGVASLLRQRLLREESPPMPPLEAELTELLLIPYLGRDEARRFASEPPAL
jgi:AcrR family transcriptional regulator